MLIRNPVARKLLKNATQLSTNSAKSLSVQIDVFCRSSGRRLSPATTGECSGRRGNHARRPRNLLARQRRTPTADDINTICRTQINTRHRWSKDHPYGCSGGVVAASQCDFFRLDVRNRRSRTSPSSPGTEIRERPSWSVIATHELTNQIVSRSSVIELVPASFIYEMCRKTCPF